MSLPNPQPVPLQAYPLSALLAHVQNLIRSTYGGYYWIVAEVMEISGSRVGHYYFTLGEMRDDKVVAKVQANLWAGVARQVMGEFESVTGGKIEKGMQIMLQVKVDFTPLYGLSLTITAINAEYTLGNLERAKRLAIERLQADGVFDLNKSLSLPLLSLRLAVISSHTAAGWGDFCRQIEQSDVSSLFKIRLFPAIMQGEQTTPSILSALDEILEYADDFDAVLVLRGGGSKLDLSAFDDYHLCAALAQFPLPVLTGIGHERDESVADLVAHTRLKTPTALADFLIRRVGEALMRLDEADERLQTLLSSLLDISRQKIEHLSTRLSRSLHKTTMGETQRIYNLVGGLTRTMRRTLLQEELSLYGRATRLSTLARERLLTAAHTQDHLRLRLASLLRPLTTERSRELDHLEQIVATYDPTKIMRRGFLPVMVGGRQVTTVEELSPGTSLTILLQDGTATTEVREISKDN